MAGVKRIVLGTFAVLICAAMTYGYTAARRERTFSQLVDAGEAALARDDTFAAIESFSGAIALKSESMLGYLKRGEAYRRRQQLDSAGRDPHQVVKLDPAADAAMRDLLRATELDPLAPRPLELLGDVNYAMRRFGRAAERYQRYIELDDRSPKVLYKLGLALYSGRRPGAAIAALEKATARNWRICMDASDGSTIALRSSRRWLRSIAARPGTSRSVSPTPATDSSTVP
jgi:tetratricopeptide (TPR) repeat protein